MKKRSIHYSAYLLLFAIFLGSCKAKISDSKIKAISDQTEMLGGKVSAANIEGHNVSYFEFILCKKRTNRKKGQSPKFEKFSECVNPFLDQEGRKALFLLLPSDHLAASTQKRFGTIPTKQRLKTEGYGKLSLSYLTFGVTVTLTAVLAVEALAFTSALAASSTIWGSIGLTSQLTAFSFAVSPTMESIEYIENATKQGAEAAHEFGRSERELSAVWDNILDDNWKNPKPISEIDFGPFKPKNKTVRDFVTLIQEELNLTLNPKIYLLKTYESKF